MKDLVSLIIIMAQDLFAYFYFLVIQNNSVIRFSKTIVLLLGNVLLSIEVMAMNFEH